MEIPNQTLLFRTVNTTTFRRKNEPKPSASAFALTQNDHGRLSVDDSRSTTPEDTAGRFGATIRQKGGFKQISLMEIWQFSAGDVRNFSESIKIYPSPTNRNPERQGRPNNLSHTTIDLNGISALDLPDFYIHIRKFSSERKFDREKAEAIALRLKKNWSMI